MKKYVVCIVAYMYIEMQQDYNHPDLVSPITKKNYQLDYYFPRIKLAVDFLVNKIFIITKK